MVTLETQRSYITGQCAKGQTARQVRFRSDVFYRTYHGTGVEQAESMPSFEQTSAVLLIAKLEPSAIDVSKSLASFTGNSSRATDKLCCAGSAIPPVRDTRVARRA